MGVGPVTDAGVVVELATVAARVNTSRDTWQMG
jgi:hypothetical protein